MPRDGEGRPERCPAAHPLHVSDSFGREVVAFFIAIVHRPAMFGLHPLDPTEDGPVEYVRLGQRNHHGHRQGNDERGHTSEQTRQRSASGCHRDLSVVVVRSPEPY